MKCTPLHISVLTNIHCSPVMWDQHDNDVSRKCMRDLERWGMCKHAGTNAQALTDQGKAWLDDILEVPAQDKCPQCLGSGKAEWQQVDHSITVTCPVCMGNGVSIERMLQQMEDEVTARVLAALKG